MEQVRANLIAAVERSGISLLRLSRMIGRNDAYLQQFVQRGSPRRLPERERSILSDYLGIPAAALGGPEADAVPVRRLDVAASAGPGAFPDDDRLAAVEQFPATMLRRLALAPGALTLIAARGESMLPTIADGDDILVDTADRRVGRKPAIFVLRHDGAVIVKRLALSGGEIVVTSDNPAAPAIASIAADRTEIVGRVVWLGRRLT
ncbi:MAG: S24 family peptidase [Pseudomonadota bacterium]